MKLSKYLELEWTLMTFKLLESILCLIKRDHILSSFLRSEHRSPNKCYIETLNVKTFVLLFYQQMAFFLLLEGFSCKNLLLDS